MALSVVNNGASLNAQSNLNRTNSALSQSLERLSTGLKINRGADGPAGLVISEQQRAQIAGLQTAIANTNKAVSLVQTGEGALNEISTLLTKVRSLALDSANSGVNDASAVAANQAEIANALGTITQIATTTQFGTKKLLDGSASLAATTSSPNLGVSVADSTAPGAYQINITTAAKRANQLAQANFTNFSQGILTGTDVTSSGAGGTVASRTSAGALDAANADALAVGGAYTGVTNRVYQVKILSASAATIGAGVTNFQITDQSTGEIKNISVNGATYNPGDAITDPLLQGLSFSFTAANKVAAGDTFTFQATGTGTLSLNGTDIALNGNNSGSLADTINTINSYSAQTGVKAVVDPTTSTRIAFESTTFGTGGDFGIKVDALTKAKLGLTSLTAGTVNNTSAAANGATKGVEAVGTISNDGGITTNALQVSGNVVSGYGLNITLQDDPASTTFTSVHPTAGVVNVADNGLVFQIGANAGQTANLRFADVRADKLGTGVTGNQFANLGSIDVTTAAGAQDAIAVIDQAISNVSSLRGKLGAFQTNTLESNASNLQSTLENTTAAESVVRDTDFASEIANFTRLQTQLQAGATVLSNANQTTQLITTLLRG